MWMLRQYDYTFRFCAENYRSLGLFYVFRARLMGCFLFNQKVRGNTPKTCRRNSSILPPPFVELQINIIPFFLIFPSHYPFISFVSTQLLYESKTTICEFVLGLIIITIYKLFFIQLAVNMNERGRFLFSCFRTPYGLVLFICFQQTHVNS